MIEVVEDFCGPLFETIAFLSDIKILLFDSDADVGVGRIMTLLFEVAKRFLAIDFGVLFVGVVDLAETTLFEATGNCLGWIAA